jgi:hypothetical protein
MLLVFAAALSSPPTPTISSGTPQTATIFMGLSAYRDIRCGYTLLDAFERAESPHRLSFGVVEQLAPEDRKCVDIFCELAESAGSKFVTADGSCKYKDQIKVYHMDYTESKGPIIARANQETLIADQEFCLQVDAHSNFATGWDTKLVEQWQATGNENAILTTYVNDISERDSSSAQQPHLCQTQWGANGMVRNSQAHTRSFAEGAPPKLTTLWGAGESFGKCRAELEVPNDPQLTHIFDGEEFSRAVRLWTHGYDFYTPNTNLIFHDYFKKMGPQGADGAALVEASVWGAHPPPADAQQRKAEELTKAVQRLQTLLHMPSGEAPVPGTGAGAYMYAGQPELGLGERYGLGTRRTWKAYVAFSGVDPAQHIASTGARCDLDNALDWVPYDDDDGGLAAGAATTGGVRGSGISTSGAASKTMQDKAQISGLMSACQLLFVCSILVLLVAVVIYKRRSIDKSPYLPVHQKQLLKGKSAIFFGVPGVDVEVVEGQWV